MTIPLFKNYTVAALCIVSAGLVLVPVTRAEDEKIPEIKTTTGKTYHDVRVTNVTPAEISIMHESGVARIPMKDLPDDLKAKFGYDPEKAEAHVKAAGEAEKQLADAAKQQAEAKALMASAKPGIFLVDRYAGEQGLFVYGYTAEGLNGIWDRYDQQKQLGEKYVLGKWNIVTTGQGDGVSDWTAPDKTYILIGLPKKETYVKNSSVGGMFVKAGTVKLSDDSRIPAFRFVGLGKSETIRFDTIDR